MEIYLVFQFDVNYTCGALLKHEGVIKVFTDVN
jgi:hypothetical protein